MEEEFDLDKIDTEMRLERIRQSASKLTWDNFGQALRRNLMEKRLVFDAESRIDVIQAINFMRRSLPVDSSADLMGKLKQLADGLECSFTHQENLVVIKNAEVYLEITVDKTVSSCKIGYFGRPVVACEELRTLIEKDDYETLRTSVYSVLGLVPSLHNSSDKMDCVAALETVENWLSAQSGPPTFEKVNTLPFGWLQKRDSLRPSRIFYVAEPYYILSAERKTFDISKDCANLPYLEISLVHNDKELDLPAGSMKDPWSSTKSMAMCFCLRFSVPMLFSEFIWRRMEKFLARHSVVRQHVNAYRYTSDFDFKTKSELILRTGFPSHVPQHRYTISADDLKDEKDVIIGELYLEDMRNLDQVISLIRMQEMHNSLWESLLSMCSGRWKGGNTIKMLVHPTVTRIEVQFTANERLVGVCIEYSNQKKAWDARLKYPDGKSINDDIDKQLTAMLHKSHNVPCTITKAVNALQARGSPDPAEPSPQKTPRAISSFLDKVGDAWLPQPKPPRPDVPYVYDVEVDENPMALLASFKEFEDDSVPAPTRPEAMPRSVRQPSDQSYAHAFSDLEAICQLADSFSTEGDNKSSTTPVHSARFDSSPAPRIGGSNLSPLETARLRMAQSVNAANSGHPTTPDVFDFPDDRSVGSGSSYPSPSPHSNPFTFGVSSPLGRGGSTATGGKRRPRQRKANLGDRTASTDSLTGQDPFAGVPKKPRAAGKPTMRKPRGSRKSSGVPFTHQDLEMQRPVLQRSISDMSSFPGTPASVVASPYGGAGGEEESDDDVCDPPPPPKNLSMAASTMVHSPQVSSPLAQPTTPSEAGGSQPVRVQPARKNSLDMLPPSKKSATPNVTQRKSIKSDIYDDGVDSPPENKPLTPVAVALAQTGAVSSPGAYGSPKAETSGETTGITKPDGNKLILKISKSRASPSVDQQKAKMAVPGVTGAPGAALSKPEKKKKEPREKDRDKEKPVKERKRKAESGGKEKEGKRHKLSAEGTAGSSKQKAPVSILPPFLSTQLKNFKIPKREDPKDGKEPATPTTPVAPTLPSPVGAPSHFPGPGPSTVSPLHKSSSSRKSSSATKEAPRPDTRGQPPSSHLKKSHETQRRSSLGHPPSGHMPPVSSIPLPKAPHPTTRPTTLPTPLKMPQGAWVRPPSVQQQAAQQPPPRSPSPDDAMQVDDEPNSPEDSLRIAEE